MATDSDHEASEAVVEDNRAGMARAGALEAAPAAFDGAPFV